MAHRRQSRLYFSFYFQHRTSPYAATRQHSRTVAGLDTAKGAKKTENQTGLLLFVEYNVIKCVVFFAFLHQSQYNIFAIITEEDLPLTRDFEFIIVEKLIGVQL